MKEKIKRRSTDMRRGWKKNDNRSEKEGGKREECGESERE